MAGPTLSPALFFLAAATALCCCGPSEPGPASAPDGPWSDLDPPSWVRVYDPERAWNGHTLDLFRRRIPLLIDMNGRVVHAWPRARLKSRARLLADGSLLGLALGRGVVEYDWDGNLVWEVRFTNRLPHHDVIRLTNGHTLVVVRKRRRATDDLLEIDRQGRIVWEWQAGEHLLPLVDDGGRRGADLTHINSIQELPDNRWFRRGDRRFRPGNLLVSARNLNLIFVIERGSGRVVWSHDQDLDFQHEALMIGPGLLKHGNILLFDNGYRNRYRKRQSEIREIDPSGAVLWRYAADGFHSPTGGVEQPLANGNVLVTSSRGGRVFEIGRDGTIVWQWVPPWEPARAQRYAYDHCRQLAALGRPAPRPVAPPAGYRHVDPPAYRFALRGELRQRARQPKTVLAANNRCQNLVLPAAATAEIAYGVDPVDGQEAGQRAAAARFGLLIEPEGSGRRLQLFSDSLELAGGGRRRRTISLERWALRRVDLCVATRALGPVAAAATERFAWWRRPIIAGEWEAAAGAKPAADGDGLDDLTGEELEARREHLRALGYVD